MGLGLIRYRLNQNSKNILGKNLSASGASSSSGANQVSGASNCSGANYASGASGVSGASSASGSSTVPAKLSKLLDKYLSKGCTKEEIVSVLEELKIKYTVDNQKVRFNFNHKNYALAYENIPKKVTLTNIVDKRYDEIINGPAVSDSDDENKATDKFLDVKDASLEAERQAAQAEIDAIKRTIASNAEKTFRTFSG